MKTITKKQFLADVMHEIEMLKLHATESEKSRLDNYWFDPSDIQQCIYGQMTGSCETKRAKELMSTSCVRIFDDQKHWDEGSTFKDAKPSLNGAFKEEMWESNGQRNWNYISALEGYIMLKGAKSSAILSYIKGDLKTLSL